MVTAPVAIALLGALTSIAIVVACVATLRARAARTALRAEVKHRTIADRDASMDAGSRLTDSVAHDLNDLLTAIVGHSELLIGSLDPSSPSLQDAHEIRRAALSAGGLTRALRTLSSGDRAPIDTVDVNAVTAGADAAGADTRLTAPVLVVEDEPRVRELIRLVLVRAGHQVVAVAGPRAALEALNRQPAISLLLVDVVLPEMDGYDLVAEARKIAPRIHVVFVSGFAPDPARHPSGDGFLAKPFTVESLAAMVEEALGRAAS
jgi:CheY-like chemotaxis protein